MLALAVCAVSLALPTVAAANTDEWTISTYVKIKGGANWTRSRDVGVTYCGYNNHPWGGMTCVWMKDYMLGNSADSMSEWKPYLGDHNHESVPNNPGIDSITLTSGDGKKTVYAIYSARAVNIVLAEPVSPMFHDHITLDTHGPTTLAPRAASCRKGAYVTLKYRVNDKLSPKARVTILIKRGTTIKKTLALGLRPTGKLLGKRFKCTLAKGRYTFVVKAKDLAGNPAEKIGRNTLTVT